MDQEFDPHAMNIAAGIWVPSLAYSGGGVTGIGAGTAMLLFDDPVLGIVCIGFGISDLGAGLGALYRRGSISLGARFVGGFLVITGGLIVWFVGQPLAGAAVVFAGAAFAGYSWIGADGRSRVSAMWAWLTSEPEPAKVQ